MIKPNLPESISFGQTRRGSAASIQDRLDFCRDVAPSPYKKATFRKDRARFGARAIFGFTLVELLAVMGIIAIMLALLVPATGTIFKGTQLTQAADLATAQLALARQEALTRNQTVEVRLYQYAAGGAANQYCAMQCFGLTDAGTYVPLGKVQVLPPGILFDAGNADATKTLSSLLSSATGTTSIPTLNTGASLKVPLPQLPQAANTQYNAVCFQFFRDGSTNLPTTGKPWFLTLHGITDGDALALPPHNFCSVQIDPANGHLHTFRP